MTTFYTPNKNESLKIINQLFKFFDDILNDQTEEGLYDINKKSEELIAILLTKLYDYGVVKTYIDPRQPSVDLYNHTGDILFQITTTQTKAKFTKTITSTPNYYPNMTKLIFFILAYKFDYRGDNSWNFPTTNYFNFVDNDYVLDFYSIVEKLNTKYGNIATEDVEKVYLRELIEFGLGLCRSFDLIHPSHKFSKGAKDEFHLMKQEFTELWPQEDNTVNIVPIL